MDERQRSKSYFRYLILRKRIDWPIGRPAGYVTTEMVAKEREVGSMVWHGREYRSNKSIGVS